MTRTTQRTMLAALSIAGVIGLRVAGPSGQAPGFPSTKNGEWPYYTADVKGSRYSPLDQITASNFAQRENRRAGDRLRRQRRRRHESRGGRWQGPADRSRER